MYAQIAKALGSGFTSKQIIDYLLKKFPNQSGKIRDALAAGYTVDQIVRFLGGGKKALNMMPAPEETGTGVNTEFARTRQKDIERSQKENLYATAALAAPVGGMGANMAAKALSRALPANLLEYGQSTLQQPRSIPPTSQPPLGPGPNSPGVQVLNPQTPQPMPSQASIPQPPVSAQPVIPQRDIKKSIDLIKSTGHEESIKNMISQGVPPSGIATALEFFMGKGKLNKLIKDPKELEAAIEDYAQSIVPQETKDLTEAIPTSEEMPPEIAPEPEVAKEDLNLPEETIEPTKPIAKNETVIAPQGVGEVKEIRNGKAVVEVDGKKHQVDVEDLEKEPEEIIETVKELLKIPEVDRSSIVSLFTYDPEDNTMYIQFHDGSTYKYLDVDSEKVFKVANKMGIPVTKGKNIFGAWSPEDKQSLGATLIKEIINDPKYKKAKKGEPENTNYRRLETLYDYWKKLRKPPYKKKK